VRGKTLMTSARASPASAACTAAGFENENALPQKDIFRNSARQQTEVDSLAAGVLER